MARRSSEPPAGADEYHDLLDALRWAGIHTLSMEHDYAEEHTPVGMAVREHRGTMVRAEIHTTLHNVRVLADLCRLAQKYGGHDWDAVLQAAAAKVMVEGDDG